MPHSEEWDAVVIGSGMGGLVCGAYLAAAGRRVLIVEQYHVAGGNSHTFRRRPYEFDVGLHYLGDCGPDGLLPAIFSGLGLAGRVRYRELDPDGFDRIVLPAATIDMPVGWDRYRKRLVEAFPLDAAGIGTFLDIVAGLGEERRSAILAAEDIPAADLPLRAPNTVAWGRRTLSELFEHCQLSTPARTALAAQSPNYGLVPGEATVATHATMIDHYVRGAYYPQGGGQELVASLLEALRVYGGALYTGSRAERILVESGKVEGVVLADGRHIKTGLVVSNADYRRTILELVGAEHFPRRLVAKTRESSMALSWATVYVALDTDLGTRPNANLWWYRHDDIDEFHRRLQAGDADPVSFLFASFTSLKDPVSPGVCPPGHSNFQLMTLCPPGYDRWAGDSPLDRRYRRDAGYQAEKHRLTRAVLDAAEEAMGPFRQHVTHVETATPLTHTRYTLSSGGTPFGLGRWGAPGARPDTRTFVDGLHVVGASTRYGNGITGVAVSGIACAAQILERRLMHEVHTGSVLGDPDLLPERPAGWDALRASRGDRFR